MEPKKEGLDLLLYEFLGKGNFKINKNILEQYMAGNAITPYDALTIKTYIRILKEKLRPNYSRADLGGIEFCIRKLDSARASLNKGKNLEELPLIIPASEVTSYEKESLELINRYAKSA